MRQCGYSLVFMLCVFIVTAGYTRAAEEMHKSQVVALSADGALTLADGTHARLANLVFPDMALAQSWIGAHMLQQTITYTPTDENRYGEMMIETDQALAILRAGVAVQNTQGELAAGWAAAERSAREAKRGIWGQEGFALTAENADGHSQEFHIVTGTVTHMHEAKAATYLDFGEDWHSDFSVAIMGKARRRFAPILAQVRPGTKLRVRGVLIEENGPMIHLNWPAQLEIIQGS